LNFFFGGFDSAMAGNKIPFFIRMHPALLQRLRAAALSRGRTMTTIIEDALRAYLGQEDT